MIRKTIKGGDFKSQMVGELVFDQVPEEGSFNPVTSDAVVKAIDEAKEDMQEKIDEVTLDPSAVALGNVHLLDEVTEFPADGCILIDSETNGPGEMPKDTLLTLTSQNALAGNVAQAFVPNETNAVANKLYIYQGIFYKAKEDYSGEWDASKFVQINVSSEFTRLGDFESIALLSEKYVGTAKISATKKLAGASANLTISYAPVEGDTNLFVLHKNYYGSVTTFDIYARDSSGVHSQITYKTDVSFESIVELVLPEGYDNWLFYKGTQAGDANGVDVVLYNVTKGKNIADIESLQGKILIIETDLETGSVVATKKLAGASANLTFSYTPVEGESDYYLLHKNYYGSVTTFDIYARDSSGVHSQITYKTNVSFETWQKLVLPEGYDNWLFYKGTQAGDANGVDVVLYNVSESSLAGRVFLLERKEEDLGAEIESFKPYWFKGKKVMCIGDSITQFTYQGKGYVKYLEEFTGAKTFNAGVGGTRYAPRAASSSTVTNSDQAYANLDIYNRVHAWCTDEWTNIDAAVNYMITQGVNYSSYINALKNNPVTGVDIVVLFAGTNDFASGVALGDVGSTNASETLGAINKIIEELLAANGALKIFVFTPTIRYIGNNRTDPYYSDNWENSQGITLKEEAAKILECVEANHVPICDFYNTLGWNKYNFSTYFTPSEGTHPETGYDSIARRMAGFIQSNGF
jgi:hypothetical protein